MNVLHITTYLQGGAGRTILELIRAQQQAGHLPAVVATCTAEPGYQNYPEYVEALRKLRVPVLQVDSTFKRDLTLNVHAMSAITQQIRPACVDIIHTHAAIPSLIGAVYGHQNRRCIPIVQTVHGWGMNKTPQQEDMDLAILAQVDRIVAVSNSVRELLVTKGLDPTRMVTIPCGIPEAAAGDSGLDRSILDDVRHLRNSGYSIICCLGTVNANKNQILLIKALRQLQSRVRAACIFIGEGPTIPDLMKKAAEDGLDEVVRFYGHRACAASYLKRCDCLVLPSQTEGFGLSVLEAFREGTIAVVSDIPVLRELVEDGRTGFWFKSNDSEAAADAIVKALTLPARERATMHRQAYEAFQAHFSVSAMCDGYEQLYRNLMN